MRLKRLEAGKEEKAVQDLRKKFIKEEGQWRLESELEGEEVDRSNNLCGIVELLYLLSIFRQHAASIYAFVCVLRVCVCQKIF